MNRFICRILACWLPCFAAVSLLLTTTAVEAKPKCAANTGYLNLKNAAVPMHFGRVNLASVYLQPPGTLLASVVVPPTHYTYNGASAETVLWECRDVNPQELYFLVATNGQHRYAGHNDVSEGNGVDHVYATAVGYVGLRQRMGDVVLSKFWQRVDLSGYDTNCGTPGKENICIRLKHIPPLYAQLYRVSRLPPANDAAGGVERTCSLIEPTSAGAAYTCHVPNGYIQLVGPGLAHDNAGENSKDHDRFWKADNGLGYSLPEAEVSTTASCVVRYATPLVEFAPVSVTELVAGGGTARNFSVEVECSNKAIVDRADHAGRIHHDTVIGFQVSSGAYAAAQRLGGEIVDRHTGDVSFLLSDQYGSNGIARGVGIRLSSTRDNGGHPYRLFAGHLGGRKAKNSASWHPVYQGAQRVEDMRSGYSQWQLDFTATLMALPKALNEPVTPGEVKATAYVLVKVQ